MLIATPACEYELEKLIQGDLVNQFDMRDTSASEILSSYTSK